MDGGAGEHSTPAADVGGTRKGESLLKVASNLLANYSKYAVALHARLERKRMGHGNASLTELIALGRRLQTVDFVTFTCILADLLERQRVFTLTVQKETFACCFVTFL